MAEIPRLALAGVVLDAPDPRALAEFYRRLLAWELVTDEPCWVQLAPPGGGRPRLSSRRSRRTCGRPGPPAPGTSR